MFRNGISLILDAPEQTLQAKARPESTLLNPALKIFQRVPLNAKVLPFIRTRHPDTPAVAGKVFSLTQQSLATRFCPTLSVASIFLPRRGFALKKRVCQRRHFWGALVSMSKSLEPPGLAASAGRRQTRRNMAVASLTRQELATAPWRAKEETCEEPCPGPGFWPGACTPPR